MATWRTAKSLDVLEAEVLAVSPQTTIYDIGDEAHQARASDHNPNTAGVVCAKDIMQGHGLDLAALADKIRTSGHPDLAYVIFARRIAHRKSGFRWTAYAGSDPHTDHIHVSVGTGTDGRRRPPYDDLTPWGIAPAPSIVEDDEMRIITFDGEDQLYGADGSMVGGLPVLVPLTDWPRVEQWIRAGVRQVKAGVKLDRRCWHITDNDAWPDTAPASADLPEIEHGEVDLTAAVDAVLSRLEIRVRPPVVAGK